MRPAAPGDSEALPAGRCADCAASSSSAASLAYPTRRVMRFLRRPELGDSAEGAPHDRPPPVAWLGSELAAALLELLTLLPCMHGEFAPVSAHVITGLTARNPHSEVRLDYTVCP